jgi:hypothetical protein
LPSGGDGRCESAAREGAGSPAGVHGRRDQHTLYLLDGRGPRSGGDG